MSGMGGNLGFLSTTGALIKGAAQEGNAQMAEARTQERQDDLMQQQVWANKADNNVKQWNEQKNKLDSNSGLYKAFTAWAGGDKQIADHLMAMHNNGILDPKDPTQVTNVIRGMQASGIKAGADYQSSTEKNLQDQAASGYQNAQHGIDRLKPQYQQFVQPATPWGSSNNNSNTSPTGANTSLDTVQSQPTQSQPIALTGAQQTPAPPTFANIGSNKGLLNKEPLKPPDFNTPAGYAKYDKSMRDNPSNPDLSDLKQPVGKLDPAVHAAISPQIAEVSKNSALMSPENRATWTKSVQDAFKTGDTSGIRWDLAPSQQEMDTAKNRQIAGAESGKKYVDELQKRDANLWVHNAMIQDSDRILQMISDPTRPLQAGAFQPLLDEVNRAFSAAGTDLKKFGINANSIENINMLKKVLGDMTFDQISQYHLGRWTNYEVSILKQKLPSIDSDPSSMTKIALLFKNAAQRELQSVAQEKKLAYGEHGENFYTPNAGPANMYRSNLIARDEGKLPWIQVNSLTSPDKTSSEAYNQLSIGTWYEDKTTQKMHRKT